MALVVWGRDYSGGPLSVLVNSLRMRLALFGYLAVLFCMYY